MQEEYRIDRLPDYEDEPEFADEDFLLDDFLEENLPYALGKNHESKRISEEFGENDGF